MKFKTTLILILLVAIAGAYFWYIERDKPSSYEIKLTEDRILQDFKPEKIVRITVDSAIRADDTGAVVRTDHFDIQRDLSGWNLVEPANFPVAMEQMRQILESIKKVELSQKIAGEEFKTLDRTASGLDAPDVVATFYTPGTSVTLRLGRNNPIGWEIFLEVAGRDTAYTVPRQFKDRLQLKMDNSKDDFRRRKIFGARKYEISSVFMESAERTIELQKGDDLSWMITEPVRDVADKEKMDKIIDGIVGLDVRSFVETPIEFGRPRYTLTVVQGTVSQRLQIGDIVTRTNEYNEVETFCYARRSEYRQYITLDPAALGLFEEAPDEYRSRMLVDVGELEDPEHMSQEVDGERMEFAYQARRWDIPEMTTPLEDEMVVEDYVLSWVELSITGFVTAVEAQPHLATPWITLIFKFKGSVDPRSIILSRPVDGLVYAERSPGIFVTLEALAVHALLVTNDLGFLRKQVIDLPPEMITEISLQNAAGTYELMKSTNQWVALGGNAVRTLGTDIEKVLTDILPVEVVRYAAKSTGTNLAGYGLAPAYQTIRFRTQDKTVKTLAIGKEAQGKDRYAMLVGQPYVFILRENILAEFDRLFSATKE